MVEVGGPKLESPSSSGAHWRRALRASLYVLIQLVCSTAPRKLLASGLTQSACTGRPRNTQKRKKGLQLSQANPDILLDADHLECVLRVIPMGA